MSKSRSIYVICILMMLCLTVCSCAVPNTDSSVSDPVKTQAPPATSSAAEQSDVSTDGAPDAVFPLEETLDITVYTQLASKFAGSVDNLSSLLLFDIIREKCNVNFIFEHASASLASEQYGLMFASGDYADVIAMYRDSFYPGGLGAAYQDGIIISLNDLMDQGYMPWYSAILEAYPEIRSGQEIDGNILEMCHLLDPAAVCSSGPIVRTDLLDQFGLEIPSTITQWEETLYALLDNGVEIPLAFDSGLSNLKAGMFVGATGIGYDFYQVDGQVRYGSIQDEFKDFLALMNKWYADGIIDPDFIGTDQVTVRSKVVEGKVGVVCGARNGIMQNSLNAIFEQNPEDTFWLECVPWPKQANGEPSAVTAKQTICNNGWSISTACKKPELVALAIDWFYSTDGFIARNYGAEGENWNYNDEGLVQAWTIDDDGTVIDLTASIPIRFDASKASFAVQWFDMDQKSFVDIDTVVAKKPAAQDKLSQMKDLVAQKAIDANYLWTKEAAPYNMPIVNFSIEENTEYASIMSTVETYVGEMVAQFILGYESLDAFDSFVQTQKDMGIERAIEIYQTAYDRQYAN